MEGGHPGLDLLLKGEATWEQVNEGLDFELSSSFLKKIYIYLPICIVIKVT